MNLDKTLPNSGSSDFKDPKNKLSNRQPSESSSDEASRYSAGERSLSSEDIAEIVEDTAVIDDRDQTFELAPEPSSTSSSDLSYEEHRVGGDKETLMKGMQDMDEGEWGRVSDPAYEREGASMAQRAYMGDRSIEPDKTPVELADDGEGQSSTSSAAGGIDEMSETQLRELASAMGVAGRDQLSRIRLIDAIKSAMPISTYH